MRDFCDVVLEQIKKNKLESFDKDFVIILGSKIKDNGELTPLLKGRVDRAIRFGKEQFDSSNL